MLHRDDDFGEADPDFESKSSGYAGDLSSAAQRQRALEQQKERALRKQQMRRGNTGAVQANRAFTGASRAISASRARTFSAPKTIDPLEGEDDLDAPPTIRRTGYAESFRGSSRNTSGAYGGVYESLHARSPEVDAQEDSRTMDHRIANVRPSTNQQQHSMDQHEPFQLPNEVAEAKLDSPVMRTHVVESKADMDLKRCGIPAEYDPNPEPEMALKKSSSRSSKTRSDAPLTREPRSKAKASTALGATSSSKSSSSRKPSTKSRRSAEKSTNDVDDIAGFEHNDDDDVDPRSSSHGRSQLAHDDDEGGSHQQQQLRQQQLPQEGRKKKSSDRHRRNIPEAYSDEEEEESNADDAEEMERMGARDRKAPSKSSRRDKLAKASSASRRKDRDADEAKAEDEPRAAKASLLDSIDDDQTSSAEDIEPIERPLQVASPRESAYNFDFTDMRSFLLSPVPKSAGVMQCYIERNKSGSSKLFPEYQMYMKQHDRFLMAAKKRAKNRTSNYSISMDPKDHNKGSGNFIGKLRANFIGTEFSIFDHGMNPKNADPDSLHVGTTPVREELGCVLYASNVLGSRGPRKMKVAVPAVDKGGSRICSRPTRKGDEILTRFKDRDMTNVIELVNKPPRWNDHVGAYVLNFSGRVTMASVKNFQLVTPEDEDSVILQFGRVGKDLFTADLAWPLSPLQAFAICLSSFDSKLACE